MKGPIEEQRRTENFHQFAAVPMDLAYQPVIEIGNRHPTVVAYESLLRIGSPWCGRSLQSMIKQAEHDGTIIAIDMWVGRRVREALDTNPGIRVCINASQLSLSTPEYLNFILRIFEEESIKERLVIEVTESAIASIPAVLHGISMLSEKNFRVVIDDIDDGYAKRSLIGSEHVKGCKVSRVTTAKITTDPGARDYLRRFAAWCHDHNKSIVVEGIETELELSIIRDFGVMLFQGFLWGSPAGIEKSPAMGSILQSAR